MTEWMIYYLPMFLLIICSMAKAAIYIAYRSKNDKLRYLLHYPHAQIALTTNAQKRKIKLLQNQLSVVLLIIGIIYMALIIVLNKGNDQNSNENNSPITS